MDDLISRQAAIDALCDEYCGGWQDCKHYPKCENLKAIQNLPPVTPKQRTGKWIKLDMHRGMADHKCTACEQECYVPTCMGEPMYAYCPNCGAKMEVTT